MNDIEMKPVESSNIAAVGHDAARKVMRIQFSNGGLYDYHNVSAEQHQALLKAKSVGGHFHKHFRGNKQHAFTRIA